VFVQLPDGGHIPIRYADLKRPPISLWERERAAARLRAQGRSEVSESTIFGSVMEQRRIEDEARAKSRLARRATATRPAANPPAASPGEKPARPLRGIDTGDPDQTFLPTEPVNDRWR
jgi:putative transposase